MSDYENTQLTSAYGYNAKKSMIFSDAIAGSIPDSKPKIEFKRINISTRNEDGTVGELIIPTSRLYSFGVSENASMETGNVTGFTFPLCLWGKDGTTKEEESWVETFNSIVNNCIEHLVENRDAIEMYELTCSDLTKSKGGLNPLYWKKEKWTDENGKTVLRNVPGRGPTLYVKLMYSKKNDKFLTQFFNTNDEPVEARELMGKHCFTNAAVKVESIFIGSKISLQVKLYEAVVEPCNSGIKRLLERPKARSKVLAASVEAKTATSVMANDDDDDDDSGSLIASDDDTVELEKTKPVEKQPVKKVVRKVVKRVSKPE